MQKGIKKFGFLTNFIQKLKFIKNNIQAKSKLIILLISGNLPLILLFQNATNHFSIVNTTPLLPSLEQVQALNESARLNHGIASKIAIRHFLESIVPLEAPANILNNLEIITSPDVGNGSGTFSVINGIPTIKVGTNGVDMFDHIKFATTIGHEFEHYLETFYGTKIYLQGNFQDNTKNAETTSNLAGGYLSQYLNNSGYGSYSDSYWTSSEFNAYAWEAAATAKLTSQCMVQSCSDNESVLKDLMKDVTVRSLTANEMMEDVGKIAGMIIENGKTVNFNGIRIEHTSEGKFFRINDVVYKIVPDSSSNKMNVFAGVTNPNSFFEQKMNFTLNLVLNQGLADREIVQTVVTAMAQTGLDVNNQIAQTRAAYLDRTLSNFNLLNQSYDNSEHTIGTGGFHLLSSDHETNTYSLYKVIYNSLADAQRSAAFEDIYGLQAEVFVDANSLEDRLNQKNISLTERSAIIKLVADLKVKIENLNLKRTAAGQTNSSNSAIDINSLDQRARAIPNGGANPSSLMAGTSFRNEVQARAQTDSERARATESVRVQQAESAARDTYDAAIEEAYKQFWGETIWNEIRGWDRARVDRDAQILAGLSDTYNYKLYGFNQSIIAANNTYQATVRNAVTSANTNYAHALNSTISDLQSSSTVTGIGLFVSGLNYNSHTIASGDTNSTGNFDNSNNIQFNYPASGTIPTVTYDDGTTVVVDIEPDFTTATGQTFFFSN